MWLIPLALDAVHLAAAQGRHRQVRLLQRRRHVQLRQLLDAWEQAGLPQSFVNSAIITVPTVLLTLIFASMMAFAVSGSAGGSTSRC